MSNKKVSGQDDSMGAKLKKMINRCQAAIMAANADCDQTVDLFNQAMGSRSKRKFAQDLGVNVSTVSRISTGQVKEISRPLLAKVAYAADPDSGVTLDKLMQAQGLIDSRERGDLPVRFEESCRRIMADELLSRGFSVSYLSQNDISKAPAQVGASVSVETNAFGNEKALWIVECKMASQHSMLSIAYGRAENWINSAMAHYYCGGAAARISLIVDSRAAFEQIKTKLSELMIPNEISVILISLTEGKLLDEYVAPLIDGRTPTFVLTKMENKRIMDKEDTPMDR